MRPFDYQNFECWNCVNEYGHYGYALTYGNKWYSHNENDYRHYIIEYGPVTSSELPSTVDLVFGTGSTATKGDTADGTADYKSSAESIFVDNLGIWETEIHVLCLFSSAICTFPYSSTSNSKEIWSANFRIGNHLIAVLLGAGRWYQCCAFLFL